MLSFSAYDGLGNTVNLSIIQQDSIRIRIQVENPYNNNKKVPGAIVKLENDSWSDFSHFRVTDSNGFVTLNIPHARLKEKLLIYYTDKFFASSKISNLKIIKNSLLKIELTYCDRLLGIGVGIYTKYPPSSPFFCNELDSITYNNCRFIDFSGLNIKRIPRKLRKYRKYIEILIIDSTNIKKIPRYLKNKNYLRILSYSQSKLLNPKEKLNCHENSNNTKDYSFLTLGEQKILYSKFHYRFLKDNGWL